MRASEVSDINIRHKGSNSQPEAVELFINYEKLEFRGRTKIYSYLSLYDFQMLQSNQLYHKDTSSHPAKFEWQYIANLYPSV